jgi:hypothetical protein
MLTLPYDPAPDFGKIGETIFPMGTSLVKEAIHTIQKGKERNGI